MTSSATARTRTAWSPGWRPRRDRRPRQPRCGGPRRTRDRLVQPRRPRGGAVDPRRARRCQPGVAGGPAGPARARDDDPRPRQPARPALRIHHHDRRRGRQPRLPRRRRTASSATPTCRSPSPMPATTSTSSSRATATAAPRRAEDPAQPGQRRPAARRRSAGVATCSSTRTAATVDLASRRPTPSRRSRRRCAPPDCHRGWPIAWRSAADDAPMIGGRRPLQGRKPGDRRVRVERPHAPYFRYTGQGMLTAKEAASVPTTPVGRASHRSRGVLFGRPLASEEELGERLSKTKALAIFSSDAISSSAYATEEILRVLILGGVAALAFGARDQHRHLRAARRGGDLATARSASPTRPAAARTRSRGGTSAGRSASSPPRRC